MWNKDVVNDFSNILSKRGKFYFKCLQNVFFPILDTQLTRIPIYFIDIF